MISFYHKYSLLKNFNNCVYLDSKLMRRWQSGQLQLTVNQSPFGLRRFESYPAHK